MTRPPLREREDEPAIDARPGHHDPTAGGGSIRRSRRQRRRRVRRIAAGIVAAFAAVVVGSWLGAVLGVGNESVAARTGEWMRDHHLGFVVDRVDQFQTEHDQPRRGGTPPKALTRAAPASPQAGGGRSGAGGAVSSARVAAALPAPMPSPAATPFPGEGVWQPAGPVDADGHAGVYVTHVHPNGTTTSLVDVVARVDPTRTRITLVPGTRLPGGTWSHPPMITAAECRTAILAFNGGFRFDQSDGGFYADGHEAANAPLRLGAASLAVFRDGSVTVGTWGRDVGPTDLPRIAEVRQNLALMVDQGAVVPDIDVTPRWGARLRNSLYVWRSGYGVTASGELIYVGGPGLTPHDLADRLVAAGSVRAMQGDINPDWVTANLVHDDGSGCHGTKGLDAPADQGGQKASGDRYLSPDSRDFVEVLAR